MRTLFAMMGPIKARKDNFISDSFVMSMAQQEY